MTGNGAGDGAPVVPRVDTSRCRPVGPYDDAASHAIYVHDEFAEDGLVDTEYLFALSHVVQFGDAVRSQVAIVQRVRVGGFYNGCGSELGDGDMVWMSIAPIWPEGDDNIGAHMAYMSGDLRDGLCRVCLIQVAIHVIEEIHVANIKHFRRVQQFVLARLPEGLIFAK